MSLFSVRVLSPLQHLWPCSHTPVRSEHRLTYLQLFFLREPSNPFPGRRLTHEGHDPHQRLMTAQHLCDLLHALAEGREDHDACAPLSGRLRVWTNHSRVQSQSNHAFESGPITAEFSHNLTTPSSLDQSQQSSVTI